MDRIGIGRELVDVSGEEGEVGEGEEGGEGEEEELVPSAEGEETAAAPPGDKEGDEGRGCEEELGQDDVLSLRGVRREAEDANSQCQACEEKRSAGEGTKGGEGHGPEERIGTRSA
jgi:hypothetical protein